MILPDTPGERRKVQVDVALSNDAIDVDAEVALVDDGNLRGPDAVTEQAGEAEDAVGAPDGIRGVYPNLVARLAPEEVIDVEPKSDEDDDAGGDMADEEELVEHLAHLQDRERDDEGHSKHGDDAPIPPIFFQLFPVFARLDVHMEPDEAV